MFLPRIPKHRERIDWSVVTHVRLKLGAKADTPVGARIVDHIRSRSSPDGVVSIEALKPGFPATRTYPTLEQAVRADLRHFGNLCVFRPNVTGQSGRT